MSTKPKILIVDDDPDLRRGLTLRLRANHYDTSYATDGFSAIAMAQKERPDLIILDIGLPAGDGFVVLKTSVFVQINSSSGHGVDRLLRAKRFSRPWPSNHASRSLFIHHRPTAYFLKTRLVPADEKLDRKS